MVSSLACSPQPAGPQCIDNATSRWRNLLCHTVRSAHGVVAAQPQTWTSSLVAAYSPQGRLQLAGPCRVARPGNPHGRAPARPRAAGAFYGGHKAELAEQLARACARCDRSPPADGPPSTAPVHAPLAGRDQALVGASEPPLAGWLPRASESVSRSSSRRHGTRRVGRSVVTARAGWSGRRSGLRINLPPRSTVPRLVDAAHPRV